MSTPKHTPTPWTYSESFGDTIQKFGITRHNRQYLIAESQDKANAAHIVKCVNLHDELVASLENYILTYDTLPVKNENYLNQLKELLNHARGEK